MITTLHEPEMLQVWESIGGGRATHVMHGMGTRVANRKYAEGAHQRRALAGASSFENNPALGPSLTKSGCHSNNVVDCS